MIGPDGTAPLRDYLQENADHDERVRYLTEKAEAQSLLLAGMEPGDPRIPVAQRLLDLMQQSAATAETNRAIFCYETTGK